MVKQKVLLGLKEHDRGKLIMACGTGKTFTSLCVAEEIFGEGKIILYMVPSLALMSQTIREWKNDAVHEFTSFPYFKTLIHFISSRFNLSPITTS